MFSKNGENRTYKINISGQPVIVSQQVYELYTKMRRRAKYLEEQDLSHGLVSYHSMDYDDISGEETIPDLTSPSVEDVALISLLTERLHRCIAMLPEPERRLIQNIYFNDKSVAQLSRECGLPSTTLHYQLLSTLRKLRSLME